MESVGSSNERVASQKLCMAWNILFKDVVFICTTSVDCHPHCMSYDDSHNHITTRISIQTAGLAFGGTGLCTYRVRGVDGSCAQHLTVESYTVIYDANSRVFHHPVSFIPDLKPSFSANPFQCSLSFSSSGLTMWIPQTFTVTSEHIRFLLFTFSVLHFLVVVSVG